MSGSDAVWPDGAREALWQLSGDRFEFDDVAILTALEPFVQQRIAEARPVCSVCAGKGTPVSGGACICGGVGTQAAELQGFRAEVARLREDGERYTWLREQVETSHDGETGESFVRFDALALLNGWVAAKDERAVDLAIDAARFARGGEG